MQQDVRQEQVRPLREEVPVPGVGVDGVLAAVAVGPGRRDPLLVLRHSLADVADLGRATKVLLEAGEGRGEEGRHGIADVTIRPGNVRVLRNTVHVPYDLFSSHSPFAKVITFFHLLGGGVGTYKKGPSFNGSPKCYSIR